MSRLRHSLRCWYVCVTLILTFLHNSLPLTCSITFYALLNTITSTNNLSYILSYFSKVRHWAAHSWWSNIHISEWHLTPCITVNTSWMRLALIQLTPTDMMCFLCYVCQELLIERHLTMCIQATHPDFRMPTDFRMRQWSYIWVASWGFWLSCDDHSVMYLTAE